MEGDTEDDDNLFDLGDDDDEEEQEDVVDGGEMGNDPYDANDWDILDTPEGQEEPVEELEESGWAACSMDDISEFDLRCLFYS